MDKNQECLLMLLSAALRNTVPAEIKTEDVDWHQIYKLATAHQVHTLVNPVLDSIGPTLHIDPELLEDWKRTTLLSGMVQVQHIQRISEVLECFNAEGIPVIVLKGLVLREYYPRPELRTMGDADLLVKSQHFSRSKELLKNFGYQEQNSDLKHTVFSNEFHLHIELHNALTAPKRFHDGDVFDREVWEHTDSIEISNIKALSLTQEYLLLHQIFHMASHLLSEGFGLRHLCDILVLINQNVEIIDWNCFNDLLKKYKLEKFTAAMFQLINQLFNMTSPQITLRDCIKDDKNMEILINDIMNGGVFGFEIPEREVANLQMQFSTIDPFESAKSRINHKRALFFPIGAMLRTRYSYANKYRFLLPIAWLHRALFTLIRKDFSARTKVSYLLPSKSINAIYEERSRLLSWLELR